ncbi:hypothetical protein AALO_G00081510 [Alosa alosa]|uniref:Ig-like domain-containing protein n=1 Tax=Alosa alosa TaxID=278164 RepID=A0AAV6GY92_9TELE|nr:hypothetical protein AALO_G00081510 [Alosa alosa]
MLGTLCTLITALAYISCQKVVTQTPLSLPVKTTEKATLNCTKLIVTDSALPAASLTLFPPSSAELQADRVTVVCVAEDLPTGFAEVSWAVSGNPVSSGISTGSPQQQPNKVRLSSLP